MTRKTEILGVDGKMHPVTSVDIDESIERWNEIRLSDGTVLRMKIVVVEVFRFDDQHDADRNPVYSVKSSNVLVVGEAAPQELKAKVQ